MHDGRGMASDEERGKKRKKPNKNTKVMNMECVFLVI